MLDLATVKHVSISTLYLPEELKWEVNNLVPRTEQVPADEWHILYRSHLKCLTINDVLVSVVANMYTFLKKILDTEAYAILNEKRISDSWN